MGQTEQTLTDLIDAFQRADHEFEVFAEFLIKTEETLGANLEAVADRALKAADKAGAARERLERALSEGPFKGQIVISSDYNSNGTRAWFVGRNGLRSLPVLWGIECQVPADAPKPTSKSKCAGKCRFNPAVDKYLLNAIKQGEL